MTTNVAFGQGMYISVAGNTIGMFVLGIK